MNRVIAVAGGSGSGKSTLAKALLTACGPERLAVLPIDAYYHDLSHLEAGAREEVNFDHPDALDLELFSRHVETLRAGQPVHMPFSLWVCYYNFHTSPSLPCQFYASVFHPNDQPPIVLIIF